MTFTPTTAPDYIADFKWWVQHHPVLRPLHSGQVFLRFPDNWNKWPAMRIYQSAGGLRDNVGGDLPEWDVNLSVEAFGTPEKPSTYDATRQLVGAFEAAVFDLELSGPTLLRPDGTGTTIATSAAVINRLDSPPPDVDQPRFVVDVRLTAIPL